MHTRSKKLSTGISRQPFRLYVLQVLAYRRFFDCMLIDERQIETSTENKGNEKEGKVDGDVEKKRKRKDVRTSKSRRKKHKEESKEI